MHSSGKIHRKGGGNPDDWAKMQKSIVRENHEYEDVLSTHSFVTFALGDKEGLLMVHRKKDGLLWRTETGATPIN